jgi:alpha-glucosidase
MGLGRDVVALATACVLAGCRGEPAADDASSPGHDARAVDDAPPPRADASRACGELAGPTTWASADAGLVQARGTRRDLRLTILDEGFVRLQYLAPDTAPTERGFARIVAPRNIPARFEVGHDAAGSQLTVCTDHFVVTVRREGALVRVEDTLGRVLLEDVASPTASADRVERTTPPDELFLGLGERTGRLDRRGRRLVMRNTDAYDARFGGYGPDADPLYQSIPFFVGIREGSDPGDDFAYGLFTDVTYRLDLDLAASAPDRYTVDSVGPELDEWLIEGPTPREVLRRYTELTGRTPQPPRWALGFHQSRWGYDDAARVEEIADELRRRSLPADAIWLDIQHHDRLRPFTFDPSRFPDPERLTARLHDWGFHVVAIAARASRSRPAGPSTTKQCAMGTSSAAPTARPTSTTRGPAPPSSPTSRASARSSSGRGRSQPSRVAGSTGSGST